MVPETTIRLSLAIRHEFVDRVRSRDSAKRRQLRNAHVVVGRRLEAAFMNRRARLRLILACESRRPIPRRRRRRG